MRAPLIVGRHELAYAIYRRLLQLRPDQWSTLTDFGLILLETGGDREQARGYLERAIELSPGSSEPWMGLANYHNFQGDIPAAKHAIDQALRRVQPGDPKRAHYLLAKERLEKRR